MHYYSWIIKRAATQSACLYTYDQLIHPLVQPEMYTLADLGVELGEENNTFLTVYKLQPIPVYSVATASLADKVGTWQNKIIKILECQIKRRALCILFVLQLLQLIVMATKLNNY